MSDIFCIIVVGYNRPASMERLLDSLLKAEYFGDQVDLLISLDKGSKQPELIEIANRYHWSYGKKTVRAFPSKQGLRSHVLQCGDISKNYRAIIVLEDDLTVSPNYYNYVRSTVDYYENSPDIAGISLYKHCINIDAGAFFEPAFKGYDVFLLQYAQSWGQCWTNKMWERFRKWYDDNADVFETANDQRLSKFPYNITTWSKQSWLKYNIAYVIENNLYFVYPYFSQTTNHAEAGEHNQMPNCDYQVPLSQSIYDYRFAPVEQLVKYDSFFERADYVIPQYAGQNVILDLYGRKRDYDSGDILITPRVLNYKILHKWKLKLRPQEVNCLYPEEGNGLFVYDLHTFEKHSGNASKIIRTRYDVKSINYRKLIGLGFAEFKTSVKKRLGNKKRH